MKPNQGDYSSDVEELLERREMDVTCWHCGITKQFTLRWVSTHRDMCCSECETLIILNTSRIQSDVARLRRQLSALHAQMSDVLGASGKTGRQPPPRTECNRQFKPALAAAHPPKINGYKVSRYLSAAGSARKY